MNCANRIETWFVAYAICAGLAVLILILLTGCELPKEGHNFNPTRPYLWTEPSIWLS